MIPDISQKTRTETQYLVICPYCKKEAPWISNEQIYGRRYGKSYMCYYCKDCDAYIGCHQNTRKPLGTMANKELRKLRIKAHLYFDDLWKSGTMKRKEAYDFLKKHFGREIHIGESDEVVCYTIINLLK